MASDAVSILGLNDFDLTNLSLKNPSCHIVLFHNDNKESLEISRHFTVSAETIVGPIFASVNTLVLSELIEAINKVPSDHPLYWMVNKPLPYIVSYQQGYPQSFYHGPANFEDINEFASSTACQSIYYDPILKVESKCPEDVTLPNSP